MYNFFNRDQLTVVDFQHIWLTSVSAITILALNNLLLLILMRVFTPCYEINVWICWILLIISSLATCHNVGLRGSQLTRIWLISAASVPHSNECSASCEAVLLAFANTWHESRVLKFLRLSGESMGNKCAYGRRQVNRKTVENANGDSFCRFMCKKLSVKLSS